MAREGDVLSIQVAHLARTLGAVAEDLRPVAEFLASYHAMLVAAGFTRDEATRLAAALQDKLLAYVLGLAQGSED